MTAPQVALLAFTWLTGATGLALALGALAGGHPTGRRAGTATVLAAASTLGLIVCWQAVA